MNYVLIERHSNQYNAGSKARKDIDVIAGKNGYQPLILKYIELPGGPRVVSKVVRNLSSFFGWIKILRTVKEGDWLLIQHPINTGVWAAAAMLPQIKGKKCRLVGLIHDLASLRGMGCDTGTAEIHDNKILPLYDAVICHNESMKAVLKEQFNIPENRLIPLGIFDYLHGYEVRNSSNDRSLVIAGNLDREKCPYVGKLIDEYSGVLHLYGVGIDGEIESDHIFYHGAFPPDELPSKLSGAFGLVWDGTSIDTCDGKTGQYLRYNNPHKTSLYLSCGIPVVVWKDAAIAGFVEENQVGITIESLRILREKLDSIDDAAYEAMRQNAAAVSEKLKAGYYASMALGKVD